MKSTQDYPTWTFPSLHNIKGGAWKPSNTTSGGGGGGGGGGSGVECCGSQITAMKAIWKPLESHCYKFLYTPGGWGEEEEKGRRDEWVGVRERRADGRSVVGRLSASRERGWRGWRWGRRGEDMTGPPPHHHLLLCFLLRFYFFVCFFSIPSIV